MQLYLAVPPSRLQTALQYTPCLVHVACRISAQGELLCRALPPRLRGGILSLSDGDAARIARPEALCRQLMELCRQRRFAGLLLDFEQPVRRELETLVRQLDRSSQQDGRRLYVPEPYASSAPRSTVLITTSRAGRQLQQRLENAVRRFGAKRLALDLERLAMELPLPCSDGPGRPLGLEELREKIAGAPVYFSPELCQRYYTETRNGNARFLLFDDGDTLHRKLQLAQELGFREAFVMLPEVEDLLAQLFPGKKKEAEP